MIDEKRSLKTYKDASHMDESKYLEDLSAKNVRPEKTKAYLAAVARNKAKMLLRKADITL